MRINLREFSGTVRRNGWEVAALLFVTLLCGLLIGTVLPSHGKALAIIGRDNPAPLARRREPQCPPQVRSRAPARGSNE